MGLLKPVYGQEFSHDALICMLEVPHMAKDNMNTAAAMIYASRGTRPAVIGAQVSGSRAVGYVSTITQRKGDNHMVCSIWMNIWIMLCNHSRPINMNGWVLGSQTGCCTK